MSTLVEDGSGTFYGTTMFGGSSNLGTLFRVYSNGTLNVLHDFNGADGGWPGEHLTVGNDGYLYGISQFGGGPVVNGQLTGNGNVFKISTAGVFTPIYPFVNAYWTDEYYSSSITYPDPALTLGRDGNFYGSIGQYNSEATLFRLTPSGTMTVLVGAGFNQPATPIEFAYPLTPDATGSFFYGVSYNGVVFSLSSAGVVHELYQFPGGNYPEGSLTLGRDGNLYGVTAFGGQGFGTIFRITLAGQLTTLYVFDGSQGMWPGASLIQASDGNFYGTTQNGSVGGGDGGTIFEITPQGVFTSLYTFPQYPSFQSVPHGALLEASDCNFYGTTELGGQHSEGSIYKMQLSTPIAPPAPTLGVKYTGTTIKFPNLVWNKIGCAATYNVYFGTVQGGESATPWMTGLTATQVKALPLEEGFYKVAAVNALGVSAMSNEVFASTQTLD